MIEIVIIYDVKILDFLADATCYILCGCFKRRRKFNVILFKISSKVFIVIVIYEFNLCFI